MIKYIISDLSEVIIQGFMGIGKELSPILSIPEKEIELEKTKNFPLFIKLMEGHLSEDEYVNEFLSITKWNISAEDFKNTMRKVLNKKIPGTIEVLKKVKNTNRYKLILLSDNVKEWIEYVLKTNNDLKIFDYMFFSYELESIKEDSITFVKVLDKINAKPEETIFIDDLITNINVAKSIGIEGIQFINAKQLEEDLIIRKII